jgi:phosphohistidine phosphatase
MRLWLLRHAKSSWDDAELPDHDRPLAPRGLRAGERMRAHLEREPIEAPLVLCSSARRARETLALVLPALGAPVQVSIEPGLYTFDDEVLLERLRAVPASVSAVLLVGHNPALQDLALRLADRGDRLDELALKFPTCALAGIELSGSWNALAGPPGELSLFVVPAQLDDP